MLERFGNAETKSRRCIIYDVAFTTGPSFVRLVTQRERERTAACSCHCMVCSGKLEGAVGSITL